MSSSDGPTNGRRSDEAFEFAAFVSRRSTKDFEDELRELSCLRVREEIRGEVRERAQRLALRQRRQMRDEVALAVAGILLAIALVAPGGEVSEQVVLGLIVFAGLTVTSGRVRSTR